MVRIRLRRCGKKNHPFYRVVVADSRARRDGKCLEVVGVYDPCNKNKAQQIRFKQERVSHWINVGAQPTETVASLLKRAGYNRMTKEWKGPKEGKVVTVVETSQTESAAPTDASKPAEGA